MGFHYRFEFEKKNKSNNLMVNFQNTGIIANPRYPNGTFES
jgi:hypothetical protein